MSYHCSLFTMREIVEDHYFKLSGMKLISWNIFFQKPEFATYFIATHFYVAKKHVAVFKKFNK